MDAMDSLVTLTDAECRELLVTDTVGRVAFAAPSGPRIVPINYAVGQGGVEFRTTAYSELATYAPGSRVAFEIDQLDSERQRGWSVIAYGPCVRVDADDEVATTLEGEGPEPWAGGNRPVLLRLEIDELTGRRVGGEHWPHPVVSGRGRPY